MSEHTQGLMDWTTAATAGLPPSAVEKFSAEIADHFAEARGKHLAEGIAADEADRAALADLGDPKKVARDFRDQHFSRGAYARGMVAVAALLLVSLLGVLISTLTDPAKDVHVPGASGPWAWVVSFISALLSAPLLIAVGRAILALLKEQYDMAVPRWAWRILVGCLLATMPSGLLIPAMVWGLNYSPFAAQLSYSAASKAAFAILPALQALHQAAFLVIGGLAVGFAIRQLRASGPGLGLSLLSPLSGLAGVVLIGTACVMVVSIFMPQPYPQNTPLIGFVNSLSVGLSILYLLPHLTLLVLFAAMRRPGAALAS